MNAFKLCNKTYRTRQKGKTSLGVKAMLENFNATEKDKMIGKYAVISNNRKRHVEILREMLINMIYMKKERRKKSSSDGIGTHLE